MSKTQDSENITHPVQVLPLLKESTGIFAKKEDAYATVGKVCIGPSCCQGLEHALADQVVKQKMHYFMCVMLLPSAETVG